MSIPEEHLQLIRQAHNEILDLKTHIRNLFQPKDSLYDEGILELSTSQNSFSIKKRLSFDARYVAVINPTSAALYVAEGEPINQPETAKYIAPGSSTSFRILRSNVLTFFQSGIASSGNNVAVAQFSDEPLQMDGVAGTTQLTGSNTQSVTLANTVAATGVQTANAVTVGNNKTLTVEVYGTATSFAVTIQGIGPSGAAYALTGTNTNGLANVQSITAPGWYQFDVTGLSSIEANVTAVSGGNVSVAGKLVAS